MNHMLLVVCIAVLSAAAARPRWHELEGYTFERYVKDFRKRYTPEEVPMRREHFLAKLREVRAFNADGTRSWRKGINHLSDRSPEELKMRRGVKPSLMKNHVTSPAMGNAPRPRNIINEMSYRHSVDYRTAWPPILTAVKDQGNCGSCWAHAATEQVETYNAIATGSLFVLSQQQLVSCVNNSEDCGGNGGCYGATAEMAFKYLKQAGGMTQEWNYGYDSYNGTVPQCAMQKVDPVVQLSGHTVIERNDAILALSTLRYHGPLSISVDASQWADYESGIYRGCDYRYNISMDHAVQLVGYGTDKSIGYDYWLVRNSWSGEWGEEGYIRLYRERDTPECGWNNLWDTDGGGCPDKNKDNVWACGQCGILYDLTYPVIKTDGTPA